MSEAKKLAVQFRFLQAESVLAKLVDEDMRNMPAMRLYGQVLVDRGDFRRADSIFTVFNTPDNPITRNFLYDIARVKLGLGQIVEAESLIQIVIDSASTRPDNDLLSKAFNIRGLIEFVNGRYDMALLYQNQSLNFGLVAKNPRCEADAMRQIGVLLWYRGHLDSALHRFYLPALALYRQSGDKFGEATTISNIGLIHGTRGDWKTDLQHQLTAFGIRKTIGDYKGIVDSYYFLTSFIPRSDHGRSFAYSYLKKGYELAQRTGYIWGAEIAYRGLRDIAVASTTMSEIEPLPSDSLFESSTEAKVNQVNRKALIAKKSGQWAQAASEFQEVIHILDSLKYNTGIEMNLIDYAEVLSMLGEYDRAARFAYRAVQHSRTTAHHQGEVEAEFMLASILRSSGKTSDALSILRQLTRALDSMYINTLSNAHPMFAFEIAAAAVHRTRGRAYALLIESLAEAGERGTLFENMERERLLPFWGERASSAESQAFSKLAQLIQDYDRGKISKTEQRSLQTRLGEIYQELLSQQNALSTSSSHLTLSPPIRLSQLQQSLSANQVYASFHISDSAVNVLVARSSHSEIFQTRIPISSVRSVIDVLWQTVLRGKLDPSDDLWKGPARFLYTLLIHPLAEHGLLHAGDHLIVSPHQSLHLLPFAHLLSESGTVLLDSVTISYAPSATQFVKLRRDPISRPTSILAFAPDNESIPFVKEEIAAIPDGIFHSFTLLSGKDATTGNLFKEWSYAGVIHIASHGSVNLLYPLYSTISCSDRSLELHEILKAQLQARFVLLSACETGRTMSTTGKLPEGHDKVSFPRAFIAAGVRSVISPVWLVEDESAAKLVARFYQELERRTTPNADQSPDWSKPNLLALSLNEAQRELKSHLSTSHPFYWAAFTLTGTP